MYAFPGLDLEDSVVLEEIAAMRTELAGLKGYVTNLPATTMDGQAVIDAYHDLYQVERSFRMAKNDLRARPVFHHQREAIEAHLTVVFAALAVARALQVATGVSLTRLGPKLVRGSARAAERVEGVGEVVG